MKSIKVFSLFILFHVFSWGGMHLYLNSHPEEVLLVIDTSYSMKKKFPQVEEWIQDYNDSSRYKQISIGTDKAFIGDIKDLNSYNDIFRTSFGRFRLDSLNKYTNNSGKRFLLSDVTSTPEGWELIHFKDK